MERRPTSEMTRALPLFVLLLAPVVAEAQVQNRLADLRLATAVRLALVADVRTRALDVSVAARDGAVAVSGEVPPGERRTARDVASAVPGVRSVAGLGTLTDVPAVAPTPIRTRPTSDRADPPASGGAVYHTVQRGDTLFSLARRYDTSVDAIRRLSGLDGTGIQIGQRLRVR